MRAVYFFSGLEALALLTAGILRVAMGHVDLGAVVLLVIGTALAWVWSREEPQA